MGPGVKTFVSMFRQNLINTVIYPIGNVGVHAVNSIVQGKEIFLVEYEKLERKRPEISNICFPSFKKLNHTSSGPFNYSVINPLRKKFHGIKNSCIVWRFFAF